MSTCNVQILLGHFLVLLCVVLSKDKFNEKLTMIPLEDGSLFTEFEFEILSDYNEILNQPFYDIFPKPIGELFLRYSLWELHLTMTQGRWFSQKWGNFNHNLSPMGAQLRTVFYQNPTFNTLIQNATKQHLNTMFLHTNTETNLGYLKFFFFVFLKNTIFVFFFANLRNQSAIE